MHKVAFFCVAVQFYGKINQEKSVKQTTLMVEILLENGQTLLSDDKRYIVLLSIRISCCAHCNCCKHYRFLWFQWYLSQICVWQDC